jgi:hypothetical protein
MHSSNYLQIDEFYGSIKICLGDRIADDKRLDIYPVNDQLLRQNRSRVVREFTDAK